MDPKKDPPWHFWTWFQRRTPTDDNDKSTQSEGSFSSTSNISLHATSPHIALPQRDKDEAETTTEVQLATIPQENSIGRSQPDQNVTELHSAPKKSQRLSAFDNRIVSMGQESSSSSSSSTESSSHSSQEKDNDDVHQILPPISPHVNNQRLLRSKKAPQYPSFKVKIRKLSRHSIPEGELLASPKIHPETGNRNLLKQLSLKSLSKIFPVDDEELYEEEANLVGWASRVAASSASMRKKKKKAINSPATHRDDTILEEKDSKGPGLSEIEIAKQPIEILEGGVQDVDGLIEDKTYRPDLFVDLDAYKSDPNYAPFGFLIICVLLILWGLLCIGQSLILILYIPESENLLNYDDKTVQPLPLYFLISSGIYAFIVGVVGIVALVKDYPSLYSFIRYTSWIILALLFASTLVAFESWDAPTSSTFYRIWESEILRQDFPELAKQSFTDLKFNIVEKLQKEIKCCGMRNATEWLFTPRQVIPMSCCSEKLRICQNKLITWNNDTMRNQSVKMSHFNEIRLTLYTESCLFSLGKERKNLIMGYGIYPIIYMMFYFFIMIKLDYLILLIQREYSSWEGISRMYSFRVTDTAMYKVKLKEAFCSLLSFCRPQKLKQLALSDGGVQMRSAHRRHHHRNKQWYKSRSATKNKKPNKAILAPKKAQSKVKQEQINTAGEGVHKKPPEKSILQGQQKKDGKVAVHLLKPKTQWSYRATRNK